MLLHRIHLDLRCKEARRDLGDPYQMHATLCRVFSLPGQKCTEGAFLWRLEPETDPSGHPRLLVQSLLEPNWSRLGVRGWFIGSPDPGLDLEERLGLRNLLSETCFRFRLRANPCVTRAGKRMGLLRLPDQETWLNQKGALHGFDVIAVCLSQEQMLRGRTHADTQIQVFSALFDGLLQVADPNLFRETLQRGIGHGKTMGLGLLSLAPTP